MVASVVPSSQKNRSRSCVISRVALRSHARGGFMRGAPSGAGDPRGVDAHLPDARALLLPTPFPSFVIPLLVKFIKRPTDRQTDRRPRSTTSDRTDRTDRVRAQNGSPAACFNWTDLTKSK